MGNAFGRLTRPLKNWNIEARAHKAISQKKRPSAPTFDSVQRQIELVNKFEPKYREIASRKDRNLDDNLKKVFVTSNEAIEIDSRYDPKKPLPKDNTLPEPFEYGFYEPEPDKVPTGKITLRQAIEFIGKYSKDPENYTAESVAKEYKIDKEGAAEILEFYRVFNTFKEQPEDEVDVLAMPISMKSGIRVKHTRPKKYTSTYDLPDMDKDAKLIDETSDEVAKNIDKIQEENERKRQKLIDAKIIK